MNILEWFGKPRSLLFVEGLKEKLPTGKVHHVPILENNYDAYISFAPDVNIDIQYCFIREEWSYIIWANNPSSILFDNDSAETLRFLLAEYPKLVEGRDDELKKYKNKKSKKQENNKRILDKYSASQNGKSSLEN